MDNPPGIWIIRKIGSRCSNVRINKTSWYRASVFILTYLAYTGYHLSRKPISVVKGVLNQNCSGLIPPEGIVNNSNWCCWKPFDGEDASALLATLDSAFLFCYAGAMFFSGFIAERVNLRYFLALGMIFSGIASYLLGLIHSFNIHSLWFFLIAQAMGGIAQTTGWPGVVSCMGNWFGKGKRGLIMGVWNSHTSIGNILGSLIAGAFVESNWGLSFYVPAIIMGGIGFLLFLFLIPDPTDIGCESPNYPAQTVIVRRRDGYQRLQTRISEISADGFSSESESEVLIEDVLRKGTSIPLNAVNYHGQEEEDGNKVQDDAQVLTINDEPPSEAIGFFGALKIPGVLEFSWCLFFAKLVSYTFLYWLPMYIKLSTTMSASISADLSTLFDFGGIVGGIAAGVVSDVTGKSATTCAVMLTSAIPALFVYQSYGASNLAANIVLLLVVGALVNGPYALITTAVSAELGTHSSLQGNSKALATVTAIIDGTGSIGAAVGPLLAGLVSSSGWKNVFYMLMISDVIALMLLSRLVVSECKQRSQVDRENWIKS